MDSPLKTYQETKLQQAEARLTTLDQDANVAGSVKEAEAQMEAVRVSRSQKADALATAQAAIDAVHRQAATNPSPAELEAWAKNLATARKDHRAAQGDLHASDLELFAAERKVRQLQDTRARTKRAVDQRGAAAKSLASRLGRLGDREAAFQASDPSAEAAAELAGTRFTKAKAWIDAAIPSTMRGLAKVRLAGEGQRLARAHELASKSVELLGVRAAAVRGPVLDLERSVTEAEEAFLGLGELASRLEEARGLLAGVVKATPPSPEEKKVLTQGTTFNKGKAAAALELVRRTKLQALEAKQHLLALLELTLELKLEDPTDAENDAVQDLQNEVGVLQGEYQTASDDLTADRRKNVDAWESHVPEDVWKALDEFLLAEGTLKSVHATMTVAAATNGLKAAEQALADALAQSETEADGEDALQRDRLEREARAAFREEHSEQRRLVALRGAEREVVGQ